MVIFNSYVKLNYQRVIVDVAFGHDYPETTGILRVFEINNNNVLQHCAVITQIKPSKRPNKLLSGFTQKNTC
jgi:small nuclear ribonucleoprotein (snRNP)-like protein